MTDSVLTPISVPYEMTDKQQTHTSIDKFLTPDVFIPSVLLFISLCTINVPLAFFYTTLFIHFSSYKNTNYELYYNFMITSIILFGYFVLLIMSLYVIHCFDGINLHPNSSERPYFYFL